MEKPSKRNLFDDDDSDEGDYKPEEQELDPNSVPTAPSVDTSYPSKNAPGQGNDNLVEVAVALDEVPVAHNDYANQGTEVLDQEDEYVPQYDEQVQEQQQIPQTYHEPAVEHNYDQEAEQAKTQLYDEINNFKVDEAQMAAANEDFQQEDPRVAKFTVTNAYKIAGHVKYTVTGVDDEGEFTEQRRYREFDAIANVLKTRWPGCYIPSIPEKKVGANENAQFINERMSLLDRFMKECGKYDYIIYSQEFKIFARGKAEIDKVLQSLPRQTPLAILEKYQKNFKVNEDQDANKMKVYKDRISEFQQHLRRSVPFLEMEKRKMQSFAGVRERVDIAQSTLFKDLMKFEDIGLQYYSDQDYNKRVITHPDNADFPAKLENNDQKQRNPYFETYLWIKGEHLDAEGMLNSIIGWENVMKAQVNTEQKKRADEQELQKLTEGKKTMKSMFKSKSKKEESILTLQAQIEIANREIQDFKKLIVFLTIYHGDTQIPNFKADKYKLYMKQLNNFSVKEISNSHLNATLYHSLLNSLKTA